MQLLRLGEPGQERPAVRADDGTVHDLRPISAEIDGAFLADGGIARARVGLDAGRLPQLDPTGLRIGAPVARPGKVICIGLNYRDHAAETGAKIPDEPIIFFKGTDTVIGPNDNVLIPRGSSKTDWEVELAVVIGARTRYLDSPADSRAMIAGYAVSNDVSERAFQLERGGQWVKGKSCETFNPLGPWLVPADEVPDPQSLGLRLSVNGQQRQNSTTGNMIFAVDHIIWYVSQFMVLEPGDVVNTGTPHGVAMGLDDKPYLRAGDVVELEIDGLGRQRQELVQA
ncbi:MAG TPA: fumarylacetoacetate hydrolase family protein [Mycobacteriales bacterium]|nr:fumarylacetoacetate hydrolase family protein [Mycobacteriales bacterium]